MADGYFPTLVSKDKDPNAAADPIWVQLSDGSVALTTVPVSGTFWQTTQPISGSVTVSNAGGGSAVNIQDGGNTITVDGTVGITGTVTVSASSLDIRPLTLATDAIKISANSTANGVSNPIYVALGSGPITGEVHSYDATSVTTTGNHDYTVTTAMLVKSVSCSCSGGGKFELQTGPVGTLVSKWTGFVPKAGGTVNMTFDPPIEVPVTSTGTVRIIRTNRESQAQSMYTTIVGIDA